MSNYSAGVSGNDAHFDLPNAGDGEECWLTCEHCGATLSTPGFLCAACFLNGHRSHAGDALQTQTPDCEACRAIVRMETEEGK